MNMHEYAFLLCPDTNLLISILVLRLVGFMEEFATPLLVVEVGTSLPANKQTNLVQNGLLHPNCQHSTINCCAKYIC